MVLYVYIIIISYLANSGENYDGEKLLHAELYPQDTEGLLEFLEFFAVKYWTFEFSLSAMRIIVELLAYIQTKKINLRGLNTALMVAKEIARNNNYVTCKCSQTTLTELKAKLFEEGAKDFISGNIMIMSKNNIIVYRILNFDP